MSKTTKARVEKRKEKFIVIVNDNELFETLRYTEACSFANKFHKARTRKDEECFEN